MADTKPPDTRGITSALDLTKFPVYGSTPDQQAEYQQSIADMIKSLEQRYANPNYFKVAAGFLKPQLGGFSASLGSASEAMGEQIEQQRAMELPLAEMRARLAQSNAVFGQQNAVSKEIKEWHANNPNKTPSPSQIAEWNARAPDLPAAKNLTAQQENAIRANTLLTEQKKVALELLTKQRQNGDITAEQYSRGLAQIEASMGEAPTFPRSPAAGAPQAPVSQGPASLTDSSAAVQTQGPSFEDPSKFTAPAGPGVATQPVSLTAPPVAQAAPPLVPTEAAAGPAAGAPAAAASATTPPVAGPDLSKANPNEGPDLSKLDPSNLESVKYLRTLFEGIQDPTQRARYLQALDARVAARSGAAQPAAPVRPVSAQPAAAPVRPAAADKAPDFSKVQLTPTFSVNQLKKGVLDESDKAYNEDIKTSAANLESPIAAQYKALQVINEPSAYRTAASANKYILDAFKDEKQRELAIQTTNMLRRAGVLATLLAKGVGITMGNIGGISINVAGLEPALNAGLTPAQQKFQDGLINALAKSAYADLLGRGINPDKMGADRFAQAMLAETSIAQTPSAILHAVEQNDIRLKHNKQFYEALTKHYPAAKAAGSLTPYHDLKTQHPEIKILEGLLNKNLEAAEKRLAGATK
jgi:hypothetical protein